MAVLPISHRRPARIADRYEAADGRVFLSGVQALVRALIDQRAADGPRRGILASGYQGSPLGGLDKELARLKVDGLVHRPGVNEELGATAVWGSQMASGLPGARVDGVLGVWYGKAPGVDRAADAIRHGNYAGTDPRGGVLALCGDDPQSKSSTLPSASESLLAALEVPVLAPGTVQEALDFSRHAIACSRASGLWAALKVPTEVADATAAIEVGAARIAPQTPMLEWEGAPYVHRPSPHLLTPHSLELERTLREVRLPLALEYARLNGLNRIVVPAPRARIGVVAAGVAAQQTLQALSDLGVSHVRVLAIGMPFPLDPSAVRAFAAGLDDVLVIEDKGPFLERLVKDALYGTAPAPRVLGERDEHGARLVPSTGALTADKIAAVLASRLGVAYTPRVVEAPLVGAVRAPHFCSGCPHNSSTQTDDDQLVGAGIGCHTMVMLNGAKAGDVRGLTQMGGEGAQWIGAAPFLEPRHFVQNLGDGTLHHSGSLAIRAAVAAGLHVTYKVLYNQTVAMTGGQDVPGGMPVAALVRSLEAEGVKRVIVTTEDPSRHEHAAYEVRPRKQLRRTQSELAAIDGVTVLIHDQACATELRRARKRGKAEMPPQEVRINERVCEGCGDCGEKSGCLSVEPVETEFGRKTRIHQSSCNKDFSCLEGDCPSFMEVIAPKAARVKAPDAPVVAEPVMASGEARVRLVGIGGTGVVTVSQVLGMAAMLDGRDVQGLDMTGLSQKAGPVSSDVHIGGAGGVPTPSAGSVDVLVGLDVIATATAQHLSSVHPSRTVAAISTSVVPTAEMVVDPRAGAPDLSAARAGIEGATRDAVFFDAQELALALFGDHMPANVMVLGAAWQQGAIPVSLDALRQAFELNGVAVEQNLLAFDWGRAVVGAPDAVAAVLSPADERPALSRAERALVDRLAPAEGELRRVLEIRIPDLFGWGGRAAAERYASELEAVVGRGDEALTIAVARGLHKLTAYKDEYEVARLHLLGLRDLPKGAKVKFLLHPPVLRALGMERKLKLGAWFIPAFRALRAGRRLRGTAFDPFGRAEVRRVERALPGEYLALVASAPAEIAVAVAELADVIRGYEDIKLRNVERFRDEADKLLRRQVRRYRTSGLRNS
jgi:indolepyruvate ferredoxin oxidoreductase